MAECPACGRPREKAWRYCPWCGRAQRVKLVDFFRPHPLLARDRAKALRVSRYFGGAEDERQVRFSIWHELDEDRAQADAAISLDEGEAARLAGFLVSGGEEAGERPRSADLGGSAAG